MRVVFHLNVFGRGQSARELTLVLFPLHTCTTQEMLKKPKHIVAILDCGPMMDDCNKLTDGGDYY